MKRAGRGSPLKPHQVRQAAHWRRAGLGIGALAKKLGVHRDTARSYMARHGLAGSSNPLWAALLAAHSSKQKRDVATSILILDELARCPESSRTVAFSERVKASADLQGETVEDRAAELREKKPRGWQRQFTRFSKFCASVGVVVSKVENEEQEAVLRFSGRDLSRLLTEKVLAKAQRFAREGSARA